MASPELAYYDAGMSVNYDKIVSGDGYQWLSYLSYNGNRRYVAVWQNLLNKKANQVALSVLKTL